MCDDLDWRWTFPEVKRYVRSLGLEVAGAFESSVYIRFNGVRFQSTFWCS